MIIEINLPEPSKKVLLSSFYLLPNHPESSESLQLGGGTPDPPSPETYLHQAIPLNTDDPALGRLALVWLNKCITEHKTCDRDRDPKWYPPRLLDLTGAEPRLLLTDLERPDGPYASLSHCWGPSPTHLTLTEGNFSELCAGIPLSNLPKNFRDAVHIAKWLDLKYIWIDSLCIIQAGAGSISDWRAHALSMHYIYANSILNISVTRSSHANGGCFASRPPLLIQPCLVPHNPITIWNLQRKQDENPLRYDPHILVEKELLEKEVYTAPLPSRAWVLQERLLAPRVLHFSRTQLFWECAALPNYACETHPDGIPCRLGEREEFKEVAPFQIPAKKSKHEGEQKHGDADLKAVYQYWWRALDNYMHCSLSHPDEDKFVALAGIAQRMAAAFHQNYIAGFYRNELPTALLWSVTEPATIPSPSPALTRKYRAPTWSWACMDVPVNLNLFKYNDIPSGNKDLLTEVVNCEIDLVDARNPFGQLKGAVLTIRGPVLKIAWDVSKNKCVIERLGTKAPDMMVHCRFDTKDAEKADKEGAVMLAVACRGVGMVQGLFLGPAGREEGTYVRLGYIELHKHYGCFSGIAFDVRKLEKRVVRIL